MKLGFKQIEPFVKNPESYARVILVYGPDAGLINERSTAMAKTYVSDINDPFNVAVLSSEKILTDNASFYDEASAQSLMGGNRLIIIKNGTDSLSVIIKDYLVNPSPDTLVIIESDNLSPRSSLRKLIEGAKNAAAVPCYIDDERNLAQIIRDMCTHAGYNIQQDALIALSSSLIGDRVIARNEIEKLLLYKGYHIDYSGFDGNPMREKIGTISLDDVIACCGDVRDWSMDTLVYAVGDGNVHIVHDSIQSLFKDKIAPVALTRSMQSHFWKLLSVKNKIASGLSQADAIKTLNPPLFFKMANSFENQLSRWTIPAIESALDALNKCETMCKQTEYSDTSITETCLVQLARYNQRSRNYYKN